MVRQSVKFIVAIDGPAAAGKGTIARAVAAHFGFRHLDTGLLYRALAAKMLNAGISPDQAVALVPLMTADDLAAAGLRTGAVSETASKIAAIPEIRAALLNWQREFAHQTGGAVLDGRDIGTVVCPDADVKLFVTASPEVRAKRRLAELPGATYDTVLADILARDNRDATRDVAPMKPAKDALLLDTSQLSIDAAVTEAVTRINNVLEGRI